MLSLYLRRAKLHNNFLSLKWAQKLWGLSRHAPKRVSADYIVHQRHSHAIPWFPFTNLLNVRDIHQTIILQEKSASTQSERYTTHVDSTLANFRRTLAVPKRAFTTSLTMMRWSINYRTIWPAQSGPTDVRNITTSLSTISTQGTIFSTTAKSIIMTLMFLSERILFN